MVIGADGSPKIGEPIVVEMVPWVLPISRFTVSEVGERYDTDMPAIIATTMTPTIMPFLFII
jgi:hypothetical protein